MARVTRRLFPGKTLSQLQEALNWCLDEILTGKVNDAWGAGDSTGHKWIDTNLSPERRRDMILNDLSILDPTNYPAEDNVPIKRTVPFYWGILIYSAAVGISAL